jgi:Domain of unknown function (DUF4062)/AAA ATPase domain
VPHTTVHVFVSSTSLDLQAERQAAETAVQRMRQTKFVGMEYFGSRDETTEQASIDEVDRSQVYVGIFAGRYGSGITEREYRRARERNLPRFVYFKDEATIPDEWREADATKAGRLSALKEELRDPARHTVSVFVSPADLAARVTADLHRWLFDNYLTPLLEKAAIRGDESEVRTLAEGVRDQPALVESLAARGIHITGDVIQSLLVTGSNNVIHMIAGGTRQLSADYSGRVENFLAHYLGSADQRVPFGGRRAEFARLDAWLADPSAASYLTVTGPAGRGKSALLTRWSRDLLARHELAVVFFPISVRFRTNLARIVFPSVAAQLASLHSEHLAWDPNIPAEVWQEHVLRFLSRPLPGRQTLLLILDGLDEAADWRAGAEMFPAMPPKGLRVVVSARNLPVDGENSWLRRLGWTRPGVAQTLDLGVLTLEDIQDVLNNSSRSVFGNDQELAPALYRASNGDPLIISLYLEDARRQLTAKGSHDLPMSLGQVTPGLTGYFNSWWEDQRELWGKEAFERERETQVVLDLLACALGPVSLEDVRQVAPADSGLGSSRIVEATLKLLERFIVGDGRKQGFVFSHPRLAAHFHGRLSSDERQSGNYDSPATG